MKNEITLTKESTNSEIRNYFEAIVKLNSSIDEFPVNLNEVWMLEYAEKGKAVRALKANFIESVDYEVFTQNGKNLKGGRPIEVYQLTSSCLEYLIARKNRNVFNVYRDVFHKVVNQIQIPQTLSQALKLAYEQSVKIELQEAQIIKDEPKVLLHDKLMNCETAISVNSFSKMLNIGRNKFYETLRDDKILISTGRERNLPYQRFIKQGIFIVKEKVIDKNGYKSFITKQTLITPKGQAYLIKKYSEK